MGVISPGPQGTAKDNAEAAILAAIIKLAGELSVPAQAGGIRDLAEAWAWLRAPGQPHGGAGRT